jgi:hypothetical protein
MALRFSLPACAPVRHVGRTGQGAQFSVPRRRLPLGDNLSSHHATECG